MQLEENNAKRAFRRNWFRFVLQAAIWIMFGLVAISMVNVSLNVIDLIFHTRWGYSWTSLAVGVLFIVLAVFIRSVAAWALNKL
jgi:hypothetical protein